MSVTTSSRLNLDQLMAQLPASTQMSWTGGDLPSSNSKVLTSSVDDATLQSAVTAAAAAFVDYSANLQSLFQKAQTALTNNQTYLAIPSPTTAQAIAQVAALTRQMDAVIRVLVGQLASTSGT